MENKTKIQAIVSAAIDGYRELRKHYDYNELSIFIREELKKHDVSIKEMELIYITIMTHCRDCQSTDEYEAEFIKWYQKL